MDKTLIYLVTNCYGDPNKIYIGKTKSSRKDDHVKTFGKQIEYSIIDEVQSLDKKYWKSLEIFWIGYFKFLGFILMNKNKGGGGPDFHSEETKEKMRKSKPLIFSEKMRKPRNLNFKKGINHKSHGILKGPRSYEHNVNIRETHLKSILQYDLKDNFIKEWKGIVEAEKFIKGDIGACCRGNQKTSGGFIWKYKEKI